MPIETINCELTAGQIEAVQKGLDRIGAAFATVIFTPDLQASVREHFSGYVDYGNYSMEDYANYSTERGGGRVAAKVISRGSDHRIFVDHRVFSQASVEENERLLAHEGGHVVAAVRGEEFTALQHLASTQKEYDLLASVAISIEEYRIEREVAEIGYADAPQGPIESMGWMLYTMSYDLLRALLDPGASPEILRRAVSSTLADFVKILGYAAGPVIVKHNGKFPVDTMTDLEVANWHDYVGDSWDQLMEVYFQIPGIGTPMSAPDMEARLSAAFSWYRDWMGRVGFEQTADPRGGVWFVRTSSDELWTSRLERVTAEAKIRAAQEE